MSSTRPLKVEHPHVECRDDVHGGQPVIKGTRFPVLSLMQNYRRGLTIEEILREFPHLAAAQVYDALSYYLYHQERMDQQPAELSDIGQAMARHSATKRPADGCS